MAYLKEQTFIINPQLTHVQTAEATDMPIGERKDLVAKNIRDYLLADDYLELDDVQVKKVQIFEAELDKEDTNED